MPTVKNVGEPCAGEPHARFDGGREETSDSRPRRAMPGASRLPDQPPIEHPRLLRDRQRLLQRNPLKLMQPTRSPRKWITGTASSCAATRCPVIGGGLEPRRRRICPGPRGSDRSPGRSRRRSHRRTAVAVPSWAARSRGIALPVPRVRDRALDRLVHPAAASLEPRRHPARRVRNASRTPDVVGSSRVRRAARTTLRGRPLRDPVR